MFLEKNIGRVVELGETLYRFISINWRDRLEVQVFTGEGADPQIHSFTNTEVEILLNNLFFLQYIDYSHLLYIPYVK